MTKTKTNKSLEKLHLYSQIGRIVTRILRESQGVTDVLYKIYYLDISVLLAKNPRVGLQCPWGA
jgi:hypothetical protein